MDTTREELDELAEVLGLLRSIDERLTKVEIVVGSFVELLAKYQPALDELDKRLGRANRWGRRNA